MQLCIAICWQPSDDKVVFTVKCKEDQNIGLCNVVAVRMCFLIILGHWQASSGKRSDTDSDHCALSH